MIARILKLVVGYERLVFFLLVLAFASFFFTYRYFVTSDGPAHLYNANLLLEFFKGEVSPVSDYFEMNSFPVPNWLGHVILALLNSFLSQEAVEKVFLLGYFFAFAYSFRYLVASFNPSVGLFTVLILPFGINFFVHAGFYNFCLSFVFLFLVIGFFVRHFNEMSFKRGFILMCFLLLLYFSHIMIALFAVFFLFLYSGWAVLLSESESLSKKAVLFLKNTLILTFISAPAIILALAYLNQHGGAANYEFIEKSQLLVMLLNGSALVGQGEGEHFYIHIYLLVVTFLILYGLVLNNWKRKTKFRLKQEDVFILAALIVLAGYFILPNADGKGGFISARMMYLFYLLVLTRVMIYEYPDWLKSDAIIITAVTFYFHLQLKNGGQSKLSIWAKEIAGAGVFIEPHSIVLPINYSVTLHGVHIANYLGAKKPLVILENYEATVGYFPLKWKTNNPIPHPGSSSADFIVNEHFQNFNHMSAKPDYLLFHALDESTEMQRSEKQKALESLKEYSLIFQSDFCELYELRD